jgi:hypothetical protein
MRVLATVQNTCSCCNRTHALLIYKSLSSLEEEPDFGQECRHYLKMFACAVCDPLVRQPHPPGCTVACAVGCCVALGAPPTSIVGAVPLTSRGTAPYPPDAPLTDHTLQVPWLP